MFPCSVPITAVQTLGGFLFSVTRAPLRVTRVNNSFSCTIYLPSALGPGCHILARRSHMVRVWWGTFTTCWSGDAVWNTQMEVCVSYSSFTTIGGALRRTPKAGHSARKTAPLCSQHTYPTPGAGKLLCLWTLSVLPDLFQEWFWCQDKRQNISKYS